MDEGCRVILRGRNSSAQGHSGIMAAPSSVEHCNAVACDGIGGRALGVIGTWLRGLGSGQEFSGLEPAPQVQPPSDCVLRWMEEILHSLSTS